VANFTDKAKDLLHRLLSDLDVYITIGVAIALVSAAAAGVKLGDYPMALL
jgi:hypothetical protein